MPFVARRPDGTIYGCWTVRQYQDQEEMADDHPDLIAFRTPAPPIDLSDVNNLEKAMKALALCVAQIGGLTVQQMKDLFRQKWNQLP